MFYDSNKVQLASMVDAVSSEDTAAKYRAWNWNVLEIDGNDASQIADAIIKKAAAASQVTLITQSSGVAMEDNTAVTKVLNALAGKLYYTGYDSTLANDAQNLSGMVAIAQRLTTAESYAKLEEIVFNPYTGQGTYGFTGEFIPPTQEKTEFTQAITGNGQDVDDQYHKGG